MITAVEETLVPEALLETSEAALTPEAAPGPEPLSQEWFRTKFQERYQAFRRARQPQGRRTARRFRKMKERSHGSVPSRDMPQMRDLPMPGLKLRVLVRSASYESVEEELYLLGALEELRRQHANLFLCYTTERPEVVAITRSAWFLDRVLLLSADAEVPGMVWDSVLTLSEPDPQATHTEEERRAQSDYEKTVRTLQAQQAHYERIGITDAKIDIPDYQFAPRWHKSHGYLWQLADELGLPVELPLTLCPFRQAPAPLLRAQRARLSQDLLLRGDYVLYDFGHEPQVNQLAMALAAGFPKAKLIAASRFKDGDSWDLAALMALLGHEQCTAAVLPPGPSATLAWAIGTPLLQLYQGVDAHWDGAHGPSLVVPRDAAGDNLPGFLTTAINEFHAQREAA